MNRSGRISLLICLLILTNIETQALSPQNPSAKNCPSPWKGSPIAEKEDCRLSEVSLSTWNPLIQIPRRITAKIRSGYLEESPQVPFRGNIIYYQGLGDSMINHMPLFSKLTEKGYRVISFDYLGQGGSSGSMNDTRISQIGELGNLFWKRYARDQERYPEKTIIGWSTGGLAAYVQARTKGDVEKVILIAPGLAPRYVVGEQHPFKFKFNQITLATLTSQIYAPGFPNPHLDPIKPRSPLEVMDFALDLVLMSKINQWKSMNSHVNGLVLLSGDNDTYVNPRFTKRILNMNAPHFLIKDYPQALHEIDNEAEPTRNQSHQDILDFLGD